MHENACDEDIKGNCLKISFSEPQSYNLWNYYNHEIIKNRYLGPILGPKRGVQSLIYKGKVFRIFLSRATICYNTLQASSNDDK